MTTTDRKSPRKGASPSTVLILRTCNPDMTSYAGFKWPTKGLVAAPDWSTAPSCGGGLHGFLWGEGDGSLAHWDEKAKWLVVEADAASVIDLQGKVKFPKGRVVYCGDRLAATSYIAAKRLGAIIGGTATAGDRGTATAGDLGTATAGYQGTATAGGRGTATAGFGGTATAGYGGTATAGDRGTLIIKWWDGSRYRLAIAYVGEGSILPNIPYHLDAKGQFVKGKRGT